jgi:hypothetical protein
MLNLLVKIINEGYWILFELAGRRVFQYKQARREEANQFESD